MIENALKITYIALEDERLLNMPPDWDCVRVPHFYGEAFEAEISKHTAALLPAWMHFDLVPQTRNRQRITVVSCSDGLLACFGHRLYPSDLDEQRRQVHAREVADVINTLRYQAKVDEFAFRELALVSLYGLHPDHNTPSELWFKQGLEVSLMAWDMEPLPPVDYWLEGGAYRTLLSMQDVFSGGLK